METSPFIQEKYLPGFVSSSHNQDWLDLCQELLRSPKPAAPAECWAVWQTLTTAPIVQLMLPLPSPVGDVPHSYASSSQKSWQQRTFPGLGSPGSSGSGGMCWMYPHCPAALLGAMETRQSEQELCGSWKWEMLGTLVLLGGEVASRTQSCLF